MSWGAGSSTGIGSLETGNKSALLPGDEGVFERDGSGDDAYIHVDQLSNDLPLPCEVAVGNISTPSMNKVNRYVIDDRVYLNNKPLFFSFGLDQGFYPDGIWTAPSDEALRRDIELSMAVGFNGAPSC